MTATVQPLTLSIIIPAYNEEIHIKTCLDSIAAQSVMPDEVIVVDNNSSDNTAKIAKRYSFVTVVSEKQQGVFHARNRGFDTATGTILGRIDADTILPIDWVAQVTGFFADKSNGNKAIAGGGHYYNLVFPPGRMNGVVFNFLTFRLNRVLLGHYIFWGSNMAMLRSHWQMVRSEVCGDPRIHEDVDLSFHLKKRNAQVKYVTSLQVKARLQYVVEDWKSLHAYMMMWPRTARRHKNLGWIPAFIIAEILVVASTILVVTNKPWFYLSQKFRAKNL